MAYAQKKNEGKSRWEIFVEGMRDFGTFMYNKEKGEVMGRNGKSWAKITVFFLVFYGCLAGFFAAMLTAFLATLPDRADGPKLTQYLKDKPGLKVVPTSISGYNPVSGGYDGYVKDINSFLKPYKAQKDSDEYDDSYCSFNSTEPRSKDTKKQCKYDLSKLGPCYNNVSDFKYGYDKGEPCIFFRMNKIFDWIPQPDSDLNYVRMSCKPTANDTVVYPAGFPVTFYPYRIEDAWLGPLVAVKVNTKESITLKCDLEAKNVKKSETYRLDRGAYGRLQIKIGSRA